jgi:threonine synthase
MFHLNLRVIRYCFLNNGKQYQKETGDQTKTILLSTASPYKFPESVYKALFNEELDVYDAIEKLNEKTGVAVPKPLVGIKDREVLHKTHIDKTEIINFIKSEMEGL